MLRHVAREKNCDNGTKKKGLCGQVCERTWKEKVGTKQASKCASACNDVVKLGAK